MGLGYEIVDRKSDCYGEVGHHGTHGHHNCCHGLNHMENGGLDRERGCIASNELTLLNFLLQSNGHTFQSWIYCE